jgi:hypothetical protein
MALNELTPILQELVKEPVAFCSGFLSGVLRLDLNDDPVKSWLERQGGSVPTARNGHHDNAQGPQSIDIE